MLTTIKLTKKSQMVIPKSIREAVGISEGDELIVDIDKNKIILTVKPKSYSKRLKGLHRDVWKGVDPKRYVKGERESWR